MGLGNLNPGCCTGCCNLFIEQVGACHKLSWSCKCEAIGGVIAMQSRVVGAIGIWADISDWTPDGEDYWFPWDPYIPINTSGVPKEYRLKCTLPSGQVFYSNIVSAVLLSTACSCAGGRDGDIRTMTVFLDYSLQSWTNTGPDISGESTVGPNSTATMGTEVEYSAKSGCMGGPNSPMLLYEEFWGFMNEFRNALEFVVFYQAVSGGSVYGWAQVYTFFPLQGVMAFRLLSDLTKGGRCYSSCYDFEPKYYPYLFALNTSYMPGTPAWSPTGVQLAIKNIRIVTE